MAFEPGNQLWKLRSKHGRDKLFATPELLWEAACEYFQWCEDNPLWEAQAKVVSNGGGEGSEVRIVNLPKLRVFTLHGLCTYLDCSLSYFRNFRMQDRENKEDFMTVIEKIERVIYEQKFAGASAELLNPNIIARDLGLADRQEHRSEDTITVVIKEDDEGSSATAQEDNQ